MKDKKKSSCLGDSISLLSTFLTALFVTLKITNVIDWSWFAVVSPIVIERALVVVLSMIVGTIEALGADK